LSDLRQALSDLHGKMLAHRNLGADVLQRLDEPRRASATNLLDYVFLRQHDLQDLQKGLSLYGLSSLGRLEHDVEPHLSKVLDVMNRLDETAASAVGPRLQAYKALGRDRLRKAIQELFGPSEHDGPHFMVTVPKKALLCVDSCRQLIRNGLQIARYNCSKEDSAVLAQAAQTMREASRLEGKSIKLSFELGGPKIRVQSIQTKRGMLRLTVDAPFINNETEAKETSSSLKKVSIKPGQILELRWPRECGSVSPGTRFLFDDGRWEGLAHHVRTPDSAPSGHVQILLEVTRVNDQPAVIKKGQGCSCPGQLAHLDTLTAKDRADLAVLLPFADLIGVSFLRNADDVRRLKTIVDDSGRSDIGIILKIETQSALNDLTRILLEALTLPKAGIMIARGDLAMELGFSRLLDVQQELLWFSAAAHLPVIWATQVLEQLASTGVPTRAEVSDVAKAAEADCIMINRGRYMESTLQFLRAAVTAAGAHKDKRFYRMRHLHLADAPLP
jgi:pyruvate kinase